MFRTNVYTFLLFSSGRVLCNIAAAILAMYGVSRDVLINEGPDKSMNSVVKWRPLRNGETAT